MNKIGIIDVGGGSKGAFGAGVFDYCLDNNIYFDTLIGVSAGSANCASYISKQARRNFDFYTDYALSKKAISYRNYFLKGSMINLDYIYGTLSKHDGVSPLDYEAYKNSNQEFKIVATNASSGETHYFDKEDLKYDNYKPICASSCMPVVNKAYMIDGVPYFDGYLSDPIPISKLFNMGCKKGIIILTLPKHHYRSGKNDTKQSLKEKKYPKIKECIKNASKLYNDELKLAHRLEKEGKVLIIAPSNYTKMKALGKNVDEIKHLYYEAYDKAKIIKEFIED